MVLKMTSHFPRLELCNAFDVQLISDYPEEQEWLVGFCYARILKIETKDIADLTGKFSDFHKVPQSSITKEVLPEKNCLFQMSSLYLVGSSDHGTQLASVHFDCD